MSLAVLCDFDDTVAVENVAHLILARFSDSDWRALQDQFVAGTLRPKDYFERCFDGVKASRQAMQAHARAQAHLRPGFAELARACRERDVPLAIVTHGLDFYVEAVLEAAGLSWLPSYTVHARFREGGMDFEYRYTRDGCQDWGNCKCSVAERYRAQGRQVWYVGDGLSDFCPARKADLVFARARLLEMCKKEGIPHREFRDFNDVVRELKRS